MKSPQRPSADVYPDARPVVDALLADAVRRRASDLHAEPTAAGYEIRLRIDGLLETSARHDLATGRAIVARLMVMARLLTYRLDVPQEGRITTAIAPSAGEGRELEFRLAVMPTTHGIRAAVRMPADLLQPRTLSDLQLSPRVIEGLKAFAAAEAGMLLLVGPAGSGKTTTIYALLEYIAAHSPGLSIVALEDPVERDLPGVTQIEVSPFGQLTYERALRSMLRQDPQVLMLGEIRDADTASLAIQAALSGHRLISTFHAANAPGAIARLIEMGAEPYQITSALFGIVTQRLLRRRSAAGYEGRVPIGEFARLDALARQAILARADVGTLNSLFQQQPGYQTLTQSATALINSGITDPPEVTRVLGPPIEST